MPAEYHDGNRLTLLNSGGEFFPALLAAIDEAAHEIYLETYIFAADATGRRVGAALMRAAARGIAVRLMVDGFGSSSFVDEVMPSMLAAGVHVLVYRRELARRRLRRHRLRRLHRKLAVIDRRVAFVGGLNIIDDFNQTPSSHWPRLDYATRIEGPLLAPIHRTVSRLWEIVAWASLQRRLRIPDPDTVASTAGGTQRAAFVVRNNIRYRHAIEDAYLEAIATARDEIIIANAYFLPGRRFRHALLAAAGRGVRITILLQGWFEYRLQHYATQALYGHLLAAGIRIFEYEKSYMHAKVAVIDDEWATVGSSNIDPFSLLLAKEANVMVRDSRFTADLRSSLRQAIGDGGRAVSARDWQRLSLPARLLRWMSYQLVRMAVGLAGYGGLH